MSGYAVACLRIVCAVATIVATILRSQCVPWLPACWSHQVQDAILHNKRIFEQRMMAEGKALQRRALHGWLVWVQQRAAKRAVQARAQGRLQRGLLLRVFFSWKDDLHAVDKTLVMKRKVCESAFGSAKAWLGRAHSMDPLFAFLIWSLQSRITLMMCCTLCCLRFARCRLLLPLPGAVCGAALLPGWCWRVSAGGRRRCPAWRARWPCWRPKCGAMRSGPSR